MVVAYTWAYRKRGEWENEMAIADTNRGMRGLELTDLDYFICADRGEIEDYNNAISDRNDYAIMAALDAAARLGCRATRNRLIS